MKKITFLVVFMIGLAICNGQKLYSTNTGQISFDASGGLEEIKAINDQVEAKFLASNGQFFLGVLMNGFVFKNSLMGDHFQENYAETTKFPKSTFKGFINNIQSINFSKNGTYPISADGDLLIHGVTKKITLKGTLTIKDEQAIIDGETKIKLNDFAIGGKYIGDKIAADVNVKCNLVLKVK